MCISARNCALCFYYAWGTKDWARIGPVLNASVLSDEAGPGEHRNFTGAFIGIAAYDLSGAAMPADFDYFDYQETP